MKYLKNSWQSRTFTVLLVSIVVSVLLVTLEQTQWAEQINQQGYSHSGGGDGQRNISTILMYVLPFVKEFILIGIPLGLALLVMKLITGLKFLVSRNKKG
ncbi:hypothetical protein GCM10008107_28670 [Psychrosphaera saromensis]|uniref:Uncharacterized protein n=1 Tax=Psychrosphaera saromensis TaxID=716813 RepID=A0A2S7USR8_9GAMM|nr:hypothetical protein [Psychrosphaera saromensis]PQJ52987.1 hypothetical protein BTO11_04495 [Psychrosphaera saromensis]GHB77421.1 hypothetical protein GCM10008107_28670 [Psychrosphaera saromensis]GLQ12852.1 hypothetical protein GCM10007917_03070 [Psychrosphaera saromensis]